MAGGGRCFDTKTLNLFSSHFPIFQLLLPFFQSPVLCHFRHLSNLFRYLILPFLPGSCVFAPDLFKPWRQYLFTCLFICIFSLSSFNFFLICLNQRLAFSHFFLHLPHLQLAYWLLLSFSSSHPCYSFPVIITDEDVHTHNCKSIYFHAITQKINAKKRE